MSSEGWACAAQISESAGKTMRVSAWKRLYKAMRLACNRYAEDNGYTEYYLSFKHCWQDYVDSQGNKIVGWEVTALGTPHQG